jgi:hypothetical protein
MGRCITLRQQDELEEPITFEGIQLWRDKHHSLYRSFNGTWYYGWGPDNILDHKLTISGCLFKQAASAAELLRELQEWLDWLWEHEPERKADWEAVLAVLEVCQHFQQMDSQSC